LRETRACLICITHYTFEYIGELPYPEILEILDAYVVLKGGRQKGHLDRQAAAPPEPRFDSTQEKQAFDLAMAQENQVALRHMKHISTQPFFVQQSFAMSKKIANDKSWDELFPKKR
jgi:hypothetical protein